LLRAAFDPIRIFAGTNPAIYARLLDSLGELAFIVRQEGERQLLRDQAETVQRAAARALSDPEDLTYVAERHRNIVQQLAGRPAATRR
jgi:uncharacterized membrane protein